jgi:hypothetical protein
MRREAAAMTTIDRRQLLRGAAASAAVAVVAKEALTMPAAYGAHKKLGEAASLDDRPFPAYDYTRANKLPREMTGYWEKSFDLGGATRTAKVYISPETPIRSYYTVIAVPDGVDTAEFLRKSSWRDIADQREEGLFVLEPGQDGWGDAEAEAAYVNAALSFYQSNRYFSIYGLHYLVGYGAGAPALEAWAVAHPLRVISQVYLDSPGLRADYLNAYAGLEFDGTTDGPYTNVVFPDGFDLIRYDETVLPTWYINPDQGSIAASLSYWKQANDTSDAGDTDRTLGTVFRQQSGSDRWMTSHAGSVAQVAVLDRPVSYWNKLTTSQIVEFLTYYTRYENVFAYGNQLYERADLAALGVEVRTMMVEGFIREYLVYVPQAVANRWGDEAPVVFVWPGNSQTDKVFIDATQWWKVAENEGFILVIICEQYSNTSISVSHRDSNTFYRQLRELMIREYPVDPTRFYSTGQSAGSSVTQNFAIAFPEYFAAVASTSFTAAPNAAGTVNIDGVAYPASGQVVPNYHIYGYGDLGFLEGTLWDEIQNRLDDWAQYHLDVNGLTLDDVDDVGGAFSGWHDRHQTWTWHHPELGIPVLKLTKNIYRSHNTMAEESPMMWDFLKHYSHEVDAVGGITRYYSASGFDQPGDKVRLVP